jgi:2-dehydro-3-deoxygluconokinase
LISFDTNYRASGWAHPDHAARAMDRMSKVATVVLATFDDEQAMHGCRTVGEVASRLTGLGVSEAIVKCGPEGAHVLTAGESVSIGATPVARVVDTTAAGDSFAGAYLAAKIAGLQPVDAARIAADVAATVVTHPGAIIPEQAPLTPRVNSSGASPSAPDPSDH